MDLGAMKDRVIIKRASVTHHSGGNTGAFLNVLTTWGEVKELSQTRLLNMGIVENYKGFEIKIRYRRDVTLTRNDIVTFNGADLNIHSIVEDRKKSYTIIAFANA